jgi:hypothetical protein
MSANVRLTERQECAAQLVAKGTLTDDAVAVELNLSPKTIQRWRTLNVFIARVESLQAEVAAGVVVEGIAHRNSRVTALNDRWTRMQRVIEDRARDDEMANVPGGPTGLLVHTVKQIGAGPSATTVDEYSVDTGLLKELRAHEEQAAKELGQWIEKTRGEMTGKDGGPIEVTDVSDARDRLTSRMDELAARRRTRSVAEQTDRTGS